jgi:hypothetical protein
MQQIITWWRKKRHEREFLRQLKVVSSNVPPAQIEAEVVTLLKGMLHGDAVLQHVCMELLRKANSRRIAQALCSHLGAVWPDSWHRRDAKATRFYQRMIELLSANQSEDAIEAQILLALVGQGSVREDALQVLRRVSTPSLVEHAMLFLLLKECMLTNFPTWLKRYYVGTVLAGLIVLVYILTLAPAFSLKVWLVSFVSMCLGAGFWTWLQVNAVLHNLRDQQEVLLLLMKDFLQKQGGTTTLRKIVAQRVYYLQRKLRMTSAEEHIPSISTHQ